jgi:hypothetical protein
LAFYFFFTNLCIVRASSGTTVPVIPVLDSSKNLVSQSTVGTGNAVSKLGENYSRAKTIGHYTSEDQVYTVGSSSLFRAHEKEELQRLNDKLSQYIIKVVNIFVSDRSPVHCNELECDQASD